MTPNYFVYGLVFAAPVAWISAWWFLITGEKREPRNWRNRASFVSLALVTIAGLLWIPAGIYASGTDWKNGVALGEHIRNVYKLAGVAVVICASALLVSFFGKPKLIPLLAIACFGAELFWIGTTAY